MSSIYNSSDDEGFGFVIVNPSPPQERAAGTQTDPLRIDLDLDEDLVPIATEQVHTPVSQPPAQEATPAHTQAPHTQPQAEKKQEPTYVHLHADLLKGLVKESYFQNKSYNYSALSPVSIIEGLDDQKHIFYLKQSGVETIGDLANFMHTEQCAFIVSNSLIPLLNDYIEKALILSDFITNAVMDAYQQVSDFVDDAYREQSPISAKKTNPPTLIDMDVFEEDDAMEEEKEEKDNDSEEEEEEAYYSDNDEKAAPTHTKCTKESVGGAPKVVDEAQDSQDTHTDRGLASLMRYKFPDVGFAAPATMYLKSQYVDAHLSPDVSSLTVLLSATEPLREMLSNHNIYTVRHLYDNMYSLRDAMSSSEMGLVKQLYTQASLMVTEYNKRQQQQHEHQPTWVVHYVPTVVYEQIKIDQKVKSAYRLFNEYMECSPAQRPFHAWKRVHHMYLDDTAKWMGRKDVDLNEITDADVYAFLVWRATSSFAEFDCLAGPKAIYFTWSEMPKEKRRDAIMIDRIVGEDSRNDYIADRYTRLVAIDLKKLVLNYNAKIYRAETNRECTQVDTNNWLPTSLEQAREFVVAKDEAHWNLFESGEAYFRKVPHGCVVTKNGEIPWDCIHMLDKYNETWQ